jgi:hypothetical protein
MFLLVSTNSEPNLAPVRAGVQWVGGKLAVPVWRLEFRIRSATPCFWRKCVQSMERKRVGQKSAAQVCANTSKQAA